MKKIFLPTLLFIAFSSANAQNVGINTTGAVPDAGAGLDVNYTNKGVLIPRVNIANLNTIAPVTGSSTTSMLVYNTNTTTGLGYHYWDGTQWVRLATNGEAWRTTGNAGTNITTNFIGTTDNTGLRIRTNDIERFEITGGTAAGGGRMRAINTGSAALPTYSWSDNANMGMYRAGTQTLAFSTSSAERMRIDNNGFLGINEINPSQRFHLNGNFRLQGAFMPNNLAGVANNILMSGGPGSPPVWTNFTLLNNSATVALGKFFSGPINIPTGQTTLTLADADCLTTSTCTTTWVGPLPAGPNYALLLITTAQAQNGQWIFHIQNNTGFNLNNFEFSYFAFY